jgi:hypothetical protein
VTPLSLIPRIAIFCKDPSMPELLEEIVLKDLHAEFVIANTVQDSIGFLGNHQFDLIIAGHLYKDGTSRTILRWLESHCEHNGDTPFLLFSSFPSSEIPHNSHPNFHYLYKGNMSDLPAQVKVLLRWNERHLH